MHNSYTTELYTKSNFCKRELNPKFIGGELMAVDIAAMQKRKPGKRPIFRSSITVKGKKIYASEYGHKAFVLWI